jgi:enoyl-CoA hydratase/carnithine racemase
MTQYGKAEVATGIMTMVLARAEKNAFSSAMYRALSDGLGRADKDPAAARS